MGLFNGKKKREQTTTSSTRVITKTTAGQSSVPRKGDGSPGDNNPDSGVPSNTTHGPDGPRDLKQPDDPGKHSGAGNPDLGGSANPPAAGNPGGPDGPGENHDPEKAAAVAAAVSKQPNTVAAIAAEIQNQPGPQFEKPVQHATPTGPESPVAAPVADAGRPSVESNFPADNDLSRTVNLFGLSTVLFTIVRAIMSYYNWAEPAFLSVMADQVSKLKKETGVLCNHVLLKEWVHPLHYRKTGSVLGAGRRMANLLRDFLPMMDQLQASEGKNFGGQEQTRTRELAKELLNTFLLLCNCVEMVVATDFSTEVNELAKTMRDVVDTASGNLNYVFDDVARICTTSAIRLCKLSLWKGAQSQNVQWVRQLTDNCFTVTRATKVMRVVGSVLYDNQQDQQAFQNLTTLTRGLVAHIKNIQTTTSFEPPASMNMVSFTPSLIQEHLQVYDLSIAEVQEAFSRYLNIVATNQTMIASINEVISQLMVIKNSLLSPDTIALVNAIGVITSAVEKFSASVYFALLSLGSSNEVLKEQIMETMQCAIHCCIQLHVVAASKAMFHPIINPEVTMLSAVRFLLLSFSIIIEAVSYMKCTEVPDAEDEMADLQPDEIKAAIVYILHYGRPLFKGEGEVLPPEPEPEEPKPVIHNNIFYPQGLPEDLMRKDNPQDDDFPEMDPDDLPQESFEEDPPETPTAQPVKQVQPTTPVKQPADPKPVDAAPKPEEPKPAEKPAEAPKPVEPPKAAEPAKPAANNDAALNWADPLSLPKDVVLKLDPNSYSETNLPPNFEPQPTKPQAKQGMTEEEYKAFMVQKYEFETWENKLILWKIKLKRRIDEFK